jgi:hypothetical protein
MWMHGEQAVYRCLTVYGYCSTVTVARVLRFLMKVLVRRSLARLLHRCHGVLLVTVVVTVSAPLHACIHTHWQTQTKAALIRRLQPECWTEDLHRCLRADCRDLGAVFDSESTNKARAASVSAFQTYLESLLYHVGTRHCSGTVVFLLSL